MSVLNVMSESPVANRRGGVASAFSSSSESTITLRFIMFNQASEQSANDSFGARSIAGASLCRSGLWGGELGG